MTKKFDIFKINGVQWEVDWEEDGGDILLESVQLIGDGNYSDDILWALNDLLINEIHARILELKLTSQEYYDE